MTTLCTLPEVKQLIQEVLYEGPIQVKGSRNPSSRFEAYWEGGERSIVVSLHRSRSYGSVLTSILFELHNAATNQYLQKLFAQARHRIIHRSVFVELVERMEYENALKTIALLKKGVAMGLFPPEASHWGVPRTFEDHFRLQQQVGHSNFIGMQYDKM